NVDYDKVGIWPDGLYVGYRANGKVGSSTVSNVVVLNKDDLESCPSRRSNGVGDIRYQDFSMGTDSQLSDSDTVCGSPVNHRQEPRPATYNIVTGIPAPGEPEFIVSGYCTAHSLYVSTLHIDWSDQSLSVLNHHRFTTQMTSSAPQTV